MPLADDYDKLINSIVPISAEEIFLMETENIHYSDDGGQTVSFYQHMGFEPTSSKKIGNAWYLMGRGLARYQLDEKISSVDQAKKKTVIGIFPNPVLHSEISLTTNEFSSYAIFSIDGELVDHGLIDGNKIELKPIPAGLYILEVTSRTEPVRKALKVFIQ